MSDEVQKKSGSSSLKHQVFLKLFHLCNLIPALFVHVLLLYAGKMSHLQFVSNGSLLLLFFDTCCVGPLSPPAGSESN